MTKIVENAKIHGKCQNLRGLFGYLCGFMALNTLHKVYDNQNMSYGTTTELSQTCYVTNCYVITNGYARIICSEFKDNQTHSLIRFFLIQGFNYRVVLGECGQFPYGYVGERVKLEYPL